MAAPIKHPEMIREAYNKLGLSQRKASKVFGFASEVHLNNVLQGRRGLSLGEGIRLAGMLGWTLADLARLSGVPIPDRLRYREDTMKIFDEFLLWRATRGKK